MVASDANVTARSLLESLEGRRIETLSGSWNEVLRLDDQDVIVATSRSPSGTPVPIVWLQDALDRLRATGELRIDVATVGHRSAFVGAVLRQLPDARVLRGPQRIVLEKGPSPTSLRDRELARRENAWNELISGEGAEAASPNELRRIGIYRGASGVWVDKTTTAAVSSDGDGIAVAVLHTGRHYPDDLSDTAMLYHYPSTDRPPSRDRSDIEALKECARQRLPLFVVTESEGGRKRAVRRGWVEDWDDESAQILVSFDVEPPIEPPPQEDEAFELYEDREPKRSTVVVRPNQQRFKLAVLKRYGPRCAMCTVAVPELIRAAHLVPFGMGGADHAGNGLPLCANHHDALDRGLIRIEPDTLNLVCTGGYDASQLGVTVSSLVHLRAQPYPEARRELWRKGRLSEARP